MADQEGFAEPIRGIRYKTLCFGDRTSLTEFLLSGGTTLPEHSHRHEQTGYLVRGRIVLIVAGERHPLAAGDAWCIPGDTLHGAEIIEDSIAVEIFSPPREDYLPRQ